jgi:type IV secretory pathway VirB4 component
MSLTKGKYKGSSREQINIKEVRDGVLIIPKGKYCLVLSCSSINFDLQSEAEQDRIIDSYRNLLNSLTFPVQIIMRVRQLDLDAYLEDLSREASEEKDPLYLKQVKNYKKFVEELVSGNKILSRSFYIVVPFQTEKRMEFELVKEQLNLRRDILVKSLETIGLRATPLSSFEILGLFYNFYNEEHFKLQPLQETMLEKSLEVVNA